MTTHQKLVPARGPKPGWRTSEFWVTATAIVGLAAGSISTALSSANIFPPSVAAWSIAASAAAYTISRGLAKLFPPKDG